MEDVYSRLAEDSRLLVTTTASVTALVSWSLFHHYQVRGDYAACAYILSLPMIYKAIKQWMPRESAWVLTIIFLAIYALLSILITIGQRFSPFHPLAKYPGPKSWWISNLCLVKLSMSGRRHQILDALHKKYGPIVRIGHDTLSINSRSSVNQLYGPGQSSMEKSEAYRLPGHKNAVCLFYKQERAAHSNRKRVWAAGLAPASVENYFPFLERRTWELIDCIEKRQMTNDGSVSLSECFSHWAYDLMGDVMYGGCNDYALMKRGDVENIVQSGKQAMVVVDSFGQAPWLMDIIWHLPHGESMIRYSQISAAMMHNRIKADKNSMRDLSSHLLESMKNVKIPVADLEIEAVTALFGGGDSVAGTAMMVFYYLLAEPKYYEMLYQELSTAFPDPMQTLDGSKLAAIPILGGIIDEALRLQTGFYFPRIVPLGGVVIDGNFVPEGTIVSTSAYSQQIDPANFAPDPLKFLPERWIPGGLGPDTKTDRSMLLAFATGTHVCVGKAFAYQQLRFLISRIVLSYHMSFADGFDPRVFHDGIRHVRTVLLTTPLLVSVKRRRGVDFPDLD